MRLIDADALTERIKVHAKNVKSGSRYSDDIYELAHEHIVELVGMQPTAYDPDAVVEQICGCDGCSGCCNCHEEERMMECEEYARVYEIVRKGGVHE